MSDGKLLHVYRCTPSGRRVMFIFRYDCRLKYEPLTLDGFVVYDKHNGEYHSYLFTESYNYDLRREIYSFVNHATSEEEYRKLCRFSLKSFIAWCADMNYDFNPRDCELLF